MLVYVYNMDEVILDLLVGVALAFVLVPIYGYLLHFITQKFEFINADYGYAVGIVLVITFILY